MRRQLKASTWTPADIQRPIPTSSNVPLNISRNRKAGKTEPRVPIKRVDIRGHRGEKSGIEITEIDASIALGMLARGDRKQDVASFFGWNTGRLYEIADGKKFPGLAPTTFNLPPSGPYMIGRISVTVRDTLTKTKAELTSTISNLHKTINMVRTTRATSILIDSIKTLETQINEIDSLLNLIGDKDAY